MDIVKDIDKLLNESEFAHDYPDNTSKYQGRRAIQFMNWYQGGFRPGDRMDVVFDDNSVQIFGTNAEGQFAGVKKSHVITDPAEIERFKTGEGDIWNFV